MPLPDPAHLLEHVGWVRELAQRLVRDPHAADDLTQETMLAALENGGSARSPRAWLGRVLRNVLWERVRQNKRREAREQATVERDVGPSSSEVVERVDTQRTVVDAVMRLPEHYRIVLLRRYFEGETPTQIAVALAIPIATVKTRLQRGLERLRVELDHVYGDRERWQPALLALAAVPRRAVVVSLPLLAVAALLGIGAFVAWQWSDPIAATPPEQYAVRGADVERARATPPALVRAVRTPVEAATSAATTIDWGAIKMPLRPVRGRTLAVDGSPVGGVLLQFAADNETGSGRGTSIVVSAADGTFEMQLQRSGRITAVPSEVATLCPGVVDLSGGRECCVVVGRTSTLSGTVVDHHGSRLPHARLLLTEPEGLRARLGASANSAGVALQLAETDADGAFRFEQVAYGEGCRLRVEREGFELQDVTWQGQERIEIALSPSLPTDHDVTGFVLDERGRPVADARVSCGADSTRTDPTGAFRMAAPELPPGLDGVQLFAFAEGLGVASAPSESLDARRRPRWPVGLRLRITQRSQHIRGRVLRHDGKPAAGARVWLADPTLFRHRIGQVRRSSSHSRHNTARRALWPETVESVGSGRSILAVRADENGAFVLEGLCDRDYRVVAYDDCSSLRSKPTTVAAGTDDAVVRLQKAVIAKVRGQVVDRGGHPIGGVSIALRADLVQLRWGEREVFGRQHLRGAMRTGPDGSFWLYDVPLEGVLVDVSGAGITSRVVLPEPELRVVVDRRVVLTICCADAETIDRVRVLDERGEAVELVRKAGDSDRRSDWVPVVAGRTEAFAVADDAAFVVGYRDGREVRRSSFDPRQHAIQW